MHVAGDWQAVEWVLSEDMATIAMGKYLQSWKLNLSTTKTVSAVFHFNNKETKGELKVIFLGAGATTFRTGTIALVHSTTEYCAPAWSSSAHTCLNDLLTNNALRPVNGCLPPTPSYSRKHPTCWASSQKSHTVYTTPWHGSWTSAPRSPHPFTGLEYTSSNRDTNRTTTHQFIWRRQQQKCGDLGSSKMEWKWLKSTTGRRTFIPDIGTHPPGMTLLVW